MTQREWRNLDEFLQEIIDAERKLYRSLERLCRSLPDQRSQRVIELVTENFRKDLKGMRALKRETKRETHQFMKEVPDKESLMPEAAFVSGQEEAEAILVDLIHHLRTMKDYYNRFYELVSFEKDRYVLDNLVDLKWRQIKQVKSILDSLELAV